MTTPRQRNHAATTRAILDAARAQLADVGAAGLSLRSVAREVGMVSSAVYRYVASRDELLTRLIVEAYDALGAAAEQAREGGRSAAGAVARGVAGRAVLGARPPRGVRADLRLAGGPGTPPRMRPSPPRGGSRWCSSRSWSSTARRCTGRGGLVAAEVVPGLEAGAAPAAVLAWTQLFGTVGFELFGQYENVVVDRAASSTTSPTPRRPPWACELRSCVRFRGL